MASAPAVPVSTPDYVTIQQCAEIAHCSARTVHRWLEEGRFRSTRPIPRGRGRRLVDRADFLAFLAGGEVRA